MGGCIKHPVQNNQPRFLIQLIFLFAPLRNLHNRNKVCGKYPVFTDIMPYIHPDALLPFAMLFFLDLL